jgi:putative transposase
MRTPRVVVPGAPHHVFNRGNNKRRLFSYPRDYRLILWIIERAFDKVSFVMVNALVLMANHFHLILVPSSKEALSSFMKSFAQRYATYRNRDRKASGKLFEERYETTCGPRFDDTPATKGDPRSLAVF